MDAYLRSGRSAHDLLQDLLAQGQRKPIGLLPASRPPIKSNREIAYRWRRAIGAAVFSALRWNHVRYSPTSRVARGMSFDLYFDPRTGFVLKVVPTDVDESPTPVVGEAVLRVVYVMEDQRVYVEAKAPPKMIGTRSLERMRHERPVEIPEVVFDGEASPVTPALIVRNSQTTLLPDSRLVAILKRFHGTLVLFPRHVIRRRLAGGIVVLDLPPRLHDENARYLSEALSKTTGARMTVTFQRGQPLPQPNIWISIAPNGYFVGLIYAMPGRGNPRGTVYEVGAPSLGTLVRMDYRHLMNPGGGKRSRVPTRLDWEGRKPSRIQRHAAEKWFDSEPYRTARQSWIEDPAFYGSF